MRCSGSIGDQIDRLPGRLRSWRIAELGYEPGRRSNQAGRLKDLIVRKLQTLYRRVAGRLTDGGRRARIVQVTDFARAADQSGIHSAGSWPVWGLSPGDRRCSGPFLCRAQGVVLLSFRRLSTPRPSCRNCGFRLAPSSCACSTDAHLPGSDSDALLRESIVETARSILAVEFQGNSPEEVAAKVCLSSERAALSGRLIAEPAAHFKRIDCERILGWRRLVESLLMRFRGPSRPVSVFDDVAVPVDRLAVVLQRLHALL